MEIKEIIEEEDEKCKLISENSSATIISSPPTEKLKHLQGLRGIISFALCIGHYILFIKTTTPQYTKSNKSVANFSNFDGEINIYLFYILSGRVLSHTLLPSSSFQKLSSSLFKRTIRLGLPLLGILLIQQALNSFNAFHVYKKMVNLKEELGLLAPIESFEDFFGFFARFLRIDDKFQQTKHYIFPEITPVEFIGSMFTFFVLTIIMNLPSLKKTYFLLSFISVMLLISENIPLLCYLIGITITILSNDGVFIRLEMNNSNLYSFLSRSVKFILMVIVSYVSFTENSSELKYGMLSIIIFFVYESTSIFTNILSQSVFIWLGDISFGLCLSHGVVLATFIPYWTVILQNSGMLTVNFGTWILFPAYICIILIVGYLTTILIDSPSVNLAETLQSNFFSKEKTHLWSTFIQNNGKKKVQKKI